MKLSHPMLLLMLGSLLAVHPLMLHGPSCGQDAGFHLESWIDAAGLLRHGQYPHWARSAAWHAGEPRFVFYPPLSWLIGAALTMVLPITAVPVVYTLLCLTAAGLGMHRLTRYFAGPSAALVAAAAYVANPYMLFNAFERSAFAELLAAAWMPLLVLAALRARPTVRGIAAPLALLWLTNAPAAVMGSYTLAVLASLRVVSLWRGSLTAIRVPISQTGNLSPEAAQTEWRSIVRCAGVFVGGAALGLALPAYYLIPAATERRFVQVAMAIIPNMRYQDNFLFDHTADAAHNAVNHTASVLALTLIMVTTGILSAVLVRDARPGSRLDPRRPRPSVERPPSPMVALTLLTALISFLLVPVSAPVWAHLPELAFLQFPWRLLTVLSVVLALGLALLLDQGSRWDGPDALHAGELGRWAAVAAVVVPMLLTVLGYRLYAQACAPLDRPAAIAQLLATQHGTAPTDEYTPTDADNDVLRTDNPGYWLVPVGAPNTPAPHTLPTPAELNPSIDTDDLVLPIDQTLSTPAPHRIRLHTSEPEDLVLNLRDYPGWEVTETDANSELRMHPKHIARDDGLTVIPLPSASDYDIEIRWRTTRDQAVGYGVSAAALFVLAALLVHERRRSVQAPPQQVT